MEIEKINNTIEKNYGLTDKNGCLVNHLLPTFKIKTLKTHFEIKNNCEITLEVNPDDINDQKLKIWKKLGINRLSIGIQTFDNAILKSMNRNHNEIVAKKALKKIKTQFSNYSLDLIYGAPKSTIKILKKDLSIIKDINPPHVSIYNMTVEKNTVFLPPNHSLDNSFKTVSVLCKL